MLVPLAVLCAAAAAMAVFTADLRLGAEAVALLAGLGVVGLFVARLIPRWPALRGAVAPNVAIVAAGPAVVAPVARLPGVTKGRVVGAYAAMDPVDGGAGLAGLRRAVARGEIDKVVLVAPSSGAQPVEAVFAELAVMAVDAAMYDERSLLAGTDTALPAAIRVARPPLGGWRMVAKDLEDRVLGAILLVLFLPVLALVAAGVKLSSPGPIIFKQKRHGFRGQEILVYKFRTMRTDMADYSGGNQTSRDDPRVTRLGRFLRASSLDELPQLANVVRGEMSLVGPRPHPVGMRTDGLLCQDIVDNYDSRHRVRPGITGWAQINGYRGATTKREQVEGRVRLDNDYIDNWSLMFDFRIMLLTGVRLFADDNAY